MVGKDLHIAGNGEVVGQEAHNLSEDLLGSEGAQHHPVKGEDDDNADNGHCRVNEKELEQLSDFVALLFLCLGHPTSPSYPAPRDR